MKSTFGYEDWVKKGKPRYNEYGAPAKRDDLRCGECQKLMVLKKSMYGLFYSCTNYPRCKGTHGAHPWGEPKGIPADRKTKTAREDAHYHFDQLWMGGFIGSRAKAYTWLSLALDVKEAHIAEMDIEGCKKVVSVCREKLKGGDDD